MPHDARLAVLALGFSDAGMPNDAGDGEHGLQEAAHLLAERRTETGMFVDVLQFDLLQQDVQHQDAAKQIAFAVRFELFPIRNSHRTIILFIRNRSVTRVD